jgi:hypothetical protein
MLQNYNLKVNDRSLYVSSLQICRGDKMALAKAFSPWFEVAATENNSSSA